MSSFVLGIWIFSVILAYGLLFVIQLPLRKKAKWYVSVILCVVKIVLATLLAYLGISTEVPYPKLINRLFGVLYIVFLADAAPDLIFAVISAAKKRFRAAASFISGLVFTAVYLAYAVVNMMNVVPNYHEYTTGKSERDYKIVFISDVHYGSAQTEGAVLRMLSDVKNEEPDLILLGGDITDEYTTLEQMNWIFEQFGAMEIPVYYVYGNHDLQLMASYLGGRTYSDAQFIEAIESNGITILCDEFDVVNDDLVILGRADYTFDTRLPVDKLPEMPSDKYVICVDHSPYQYDDIPRTGADLQLSGHVHAAQLFPLHFLYNFAVKNICGEYRWEDTDLCVSSGASGWCMPFRTENHSCYEVISIVHK